MAINGNNGHSNGSVSSTPGRLAGRIALITGGGMGIGATIAHTFAAEGASILIADFNEAAGRETVEALEKSGARAEFVAADVTRRADWDNAVAVAREKFGRIDILVNNAGTSYVAESSLTVSEKNFDKVYSVNVKSIFHSVQAVFPVMQEQGKGSVINISSIAALRPRGKLTWYNSSKAAVSNATKALAHEFGPDRIRVNAVCPVLVPTQLANHFVPTFENTEEGRGKAAALFQIPLGRLTTMDDVAKACLWLASDDSDFITGTDTAVDGGRSI